jgi:hypothetical protein
VYLARPLNRVGDRRAFPDIGFVGEHIPMDTEIRHIFFDFGEFVVDAKADEEIMGFLIVLEILIAKLGFDVLG